MFFVPKKYVYFIGGNTQETFFYNIIKKDFEDWGPLKKKKIKPCIALANRCHLYAFDCQGDQNNFEFIEKCDLTKGREWELIKVVLSERFPLIDFSSATDYDNKKIYLFGGKRKNKERTFVFDPSNKSLVPYEQENTKSINYDKTFYSVNEYNSASIPNIDGENMSVLLFNRRKRRFKKLKFSR